MKYAAIVTETRTIPGDERSRTNPGHGYPEHQVTTEKFVEFENQADCKTWIKGYGDKVTYRLIEFQDVEVEKEIVVNFKRPVVTRSR